MPERDPDRRPEDPLVDQEEATAAGEAGAIGGPDPDPDLDPAERAAAEHGGGEAEGFEEAERQLREAASHGDPAPDPSAEAQISREAEGDEAEHSAGDHVHVTERSDEEQTR